MAVSWKKIGKKTLGKYQYTHSQEPSVRFRSKLRSQDEPCGDEGSTAKRFRPVHPDKSDVEPVVVRCGDVTVDNAVASDTAAANIICGGNIGFEIELKLESKLESTTTEQSS